MTRRIKISRSDIKTIIEAYNARRTKNPSEYGDVLTDYFELCQFSNPEIRAGFLIIEFHKYKKKYTYTFSFYGFPQFEFYAEMDTRIKLSEYQREIY